MVDAVPQNLTLGRRRGPKPFFTGRRLELLAEYLARPESTIDGAAKEFRCSVSTVEKTLARIRRATTDKAVEGAPVSDKSEGFDTATGQTGATESVSQVSEAA